MRCAQFIAVAYGVAAFTMQSLQVAPPQKF